MKRLVWITLIAAGVSAGCASIDLPTVSKQITEAEATIRSAETAGALNDAPELLAKAREAFIASREAVARGDREEAYRKALESKAYAEASEGRVKAESLKKEAVTVRQQAEELEAKAKKLREQLQNP
jgi:hypothetical protein